ncbi:hypothetical protein VNO80_08761 [Phaseolus coccineus]|uniref:Uncharacterized protein n=1 Tax=Phaseolus coccineus TaxID=3886 RepID=A0AAN9N4Y2_PHACN
MSLCVVGIHLSELTTTVATAIVVTHSISKLTFEQVTLSTTTSFPFPPPLSLKHPFSFVASSLSLPHSVSTVIA